MIRSKCENLFKNVLYRNHFRFKHKESHWSMQAKKKTATGKALQHFDDFYKTVYGTNWPSIRQGLLAKNKFVAVVNNYSDTEKTITNLENAGALNVRTLFNLEKEYLINRHTAERKQTFLNTVNNLDKELDEKENIEKKEPVVESKIKIVTSVAEGLKNAQLDSSRIVQPGFNPELSSVLYEFVPATKLKGKEDWIPETQHYQYYENTNSFQIKIEKEYGLHFPENLNIYCFEKSNHTDFEAPRRGVTDVLDYYLLDGASILPVLALDIKPGDRILDMCASPGGKTIIALQTLYPNYVVCNDVEYSRVNRIYSVLKQYLYDLDERWLKTNRIKVTHEDARAISSNDFDCILVDVPCTNDRLSVSENDNNWFKASRIKERLQLPEVQAAILTNALRLIKIGGIVVYSTCSLSPIQNDGVVNMALKQIWEETNKEIVVKDLSAVLEQTKCIFKFADTKILRFGHLVVPYLPQNYGPMYFCKLKRIA